MSTDRIRGLQLQFSSNHMDFTRGISNIRSSMRDLNQSFRTTLNNVKFDSKSVDNYEKSISELTDAIKGQEENLKGLKSQYEDVAKEKGENSREAQNLRTEYNKQADNLNYLKNQLSNVSAEYKEFAEQQRIANSGWTTFGEELKSAGGILESFGGGLQSVGNKMTKYITTPVLGAVSALAGFTAYQGWNRLVAMDNAEARLRGMGFDTDEIMPQVREGVTGTTLTSAEGASIAAGALPAGVEQGEALEDYIRLVDSFKIASGRTADEAALIMNRVVGGGRLMTQELNQVEDALPGFTKALADAMDTNVVGLREMVTEGEVSSDLFLSTLQDYAGPISEEYANTWEGIKANVKSNIGIIGELALGGVFDTAKEELSGFLDFLRESDALKDFARNVNKYLTEAIEKLIGWIKSALEWWENADEGQRKFALGAIAVATALGPLLTILGTGIVIFGKVAVGLGAISTAVGKAGGLLPALGRGFRLIISPIRVLLRPLLTLGTRFLALSNPIGWIVTGLAALAAGFYMAYTRSEPFRNMIDGIVERLKDAWEWIVTFKDGIVDLFQGDLEGATDIFKSLGLSEETIETIQGWAASLIESFESLKTTVTETFEGLKESVDRIWTALGTIFTNVWNDYIKPALDWLTEGFENLMEYLGIEMPSLDQLISGAFSSAKFSIDVFSGVIEGLLETAERVFEGVADALESISEGDWEQAWQDVKDMFGDIGEIWSDVWDDIEESFDEHFGDTIEAVKNWAIDLWDTINEWYGEKSLEVTATLIGWYLSVLGWWDNLKTNVSTKAQELWDNVKDWFVTKSEEVSGTVRGWVGSIVTRFNSLKRDGIAAIKDLWDKGIGWFDSLKEDGIQLAEDLFDGVSGWFGEIPGKLKEALDGAGEWLVKMKGQLGDFASDLGYWIADRVVGALNTFIDGINRVAELLGLGGDLISRIKTPSGMRNLGKSSVSAGVRSYSSGTNFHPGGLALVGDKGFGNSPGGSGVMDRSTTRELIKLPDRSEWLADGNVLLDLPRGSQVMSNRDTEDELNKRFLGTEFGGGILDMLGNMNDIIFKNTVGKYTKPVERNAAIAQSSHELLEWAGDLWQYASNPGELVGGMLARLPLGEHFSPEMLKFVSEALWKLTDQATSFVKGLFKKSTAADGSYILNKSISHPFGTYNAAAGSLLFGHRHYGIDTRHNYDPLYSPINGKVTNRFFDSMAGNILQISQGNGFHWWFAHLSEMFKSIGDTVKIGDHIATTGNTGAFTTGPHLHTQLMQGGIGNRYAIDPYPTLSRSLNSHKDGGYIQSDGLFNLHANEMVIPLDNPTYAMKLIALAAKKMAGKSTQTRDLPNVAQSDNNDRLLAITIEQNGILLKMLEKLTGIEAKDLKIGDDDIGQANDRYSARQSSKQSVTTGRMRYV